MTTKKRPRPRRGGRKAPAAPKLDPGPPGPPAPLPGQQPPPPIDLETANARLLEKRAALAALRARTRPHTLADAFRDLSEDALRDPRRGEPGK